MPTELVVVGHGRPPGRHFLRVEVTPRTDAHATCEASITLQQERMVGQIIEFRGPVMIDCHPLPAFTGT